MDKKAIIDEQQKKNINDYAKTQVDFVLAEEIPKMLKSVKESITKHSKELMNEYYFNHEKRISGLEGRGIAMGAVLLLVVAAIILCITL